MLQELKANNTYEALQYVQSFIARKKRSISPEIVSSMVFHAAKVLVDYDSAGYAGTLLLWYMEGGAGEENNFHVEKEKDSLTDGTYCDLARLTRLFESVAQDRSAMILEVIQKQVTHSSTCFSTVTCLSSVRGYNKFALHYQFFLILMSSSRAGVDFGGRIAACLLHPCWTAACGVRGSLFITF